MDIVTMARDLGKALQQDDKYVAYHLAKEQADSDTALQETIGAFNLKKMELQNEISSAEKSQEKLTALDTQLKELYTSIMANPKMAAFNTTKAELEKVVNFVQQIVTDSANGDNPDSIEEASGCSGSCASCGGCH